MGISYQSIINKLLYVCIMLPSEITDYILSFCEGHVRADLRVKNVSVPLRQNIHGLCEKLLLDNKYIINHDGSLIYFVNKINYMWNVGYVSKMVSETEISYTWIHIIW